MVWNKVHGVIQLYHAWGSEEESPAYKNLSSSLNFKDIKRYVIYVHILICNTFFKILLKTGIYIWTWQHVGWLCPDESENLATSPCTPLRTGPKTLRTPDYNKSFFLFCIVQRVGRCTWVQYISNRLIVKRIIMVIF